MALTELRTGLFDNPHKFNYPDDNSDRGIYKTLTGGDFFEGDVLGRVSISVLSFPCFVYDLEVRYD